MQSMCCVVVFCVLIVLAVCVSGASNADTKCLTYQFLCQSGQKCIDKISICDGIKDCPDGSDETTAQCSKTRCPKENFRCNYGACVSGSAKCDGRVDCADKSDEENADCPVLLNNVPATKCNSTEFQCTSGKCLKKFLVCDGRTDCADGSDETIELCANNTCGNGFRCDYGACIGNNSVCNGVRNCADGSDEFFKLCKGSIWANNSQDKPSGTPYYVLRVPVNTEEPQLFSDKPSTIASPTEKPSYSIYAVPVVDKPASSTESLSVNSLDTDSTSPPSPAIVNVDQTNLQKTISIHLSTSKASNVSISIVANSLKPSQSHHSKVKYDYEGPIYPTSKPSVPNVGSPKVKHTIQTQPQLPNAGVNAPQAVVSDDSMPQSQIIKPISTDIIGDGCYPPLQGIGRVYQYLCPESAEKCQSEYPKHLIKEVRYTCDRGYVNLQVNMGVSQCVKSRWVPAITPCFRGCPALTPLNMDLRCTLRGDPINCQGQLPEGTIVRPRCAAHFETLSNYDTIECQPNGKWTNELFECIPECGRIYKSKARGNGEKTEFGEAPWFTAVYIIENGETKFQCGGTIITPYLVISAAHCYYDNTRNKPLRPESFVVAVSKYSRTYGKKDNRFTRIYSVDRIILPDEYTGGSTFYAADVALLRVTEEISLSEAVLPACIRWASSFDGDNNVYNLHGQGFVNDDGSLSSFLVTSRLAYISRFNCLRNVTEDIQEVIPVDKFCALSGNGQGAFEGDSGGGFLYTDPVTGKYFLLGVVSNGDVRDIEKTLLTDIRKHLLWLDNWRTSVERDIKLRLSSGNPKNNNTQPKSGISAQVISKHPSLNANDDVVFPGSTKVRT